MKKYALIITILILVGLALAFRFFTQEQRLDKDVFIETTESIRNLQALDKNLLLLLYQSRYNSEFDNDELADTNEQISEEFDNLRYEALFDEVKNSANLELAIKKFDEHFQSRQEVLNEYIESNISISNALINISVLSYQLTDEVNTDNDASFQEVSFQALLGKINALIFDVVIGEELQSDNLIADQAELKKLSAEIEFQNPDEAAKRITQFVDDINAILEHYQPSKDQFSELNSLKTAQLLNNIEDKYTIHHNQAITKSNQFPTSC